MTEKIKKYFLKSKETQSLLNQISEKLKVNLEVLKTKANVEIAETELAKIYLVNGKPLLAKIGDTLFPTLVFQEFFTLAPKIVVDMGAVPYVCKGANVMAPGIVRFEGEFREGDFIFVIDEKHGKPIAVVQALLDSEKAKQTRHGAVAKNIHYVGDKIWNLIKVAKC